MHAKRVWYQYYWTDYKFLYVARCETCCKKIKCGVSSTNVCVELTASFQNWLCSPLYYAVHSALCIVLAGAGYTARRKHIAMYNNNNITITRTKHSCARSYVQYTYTMYRYEYIYILNAMYYT